MIMEPENSLELVDSLSQFTVQVSPPPPPPHPPTLRDGECYHVFISYSSIDHQWTHCIISELESCGLHVCYHERDFTPGRTVLENMSDCIQESQKVLLVLSPEFVRSRWCLLEANMSLFRDCLQRKPIIPVLLQPGVSVPLHLCHLTYLEASDPDFLKRLLKVLCTPNQQLQDSTVMPFQSPSIYNGKALQPLTAVNDEGLNKWDCGQFSDMEVPDQLRQIIEDQEKYREAVRVINSVSQNKVWLRPLWLRTLTFFVGLLIFIGLFIYFASRLIVFTIFVKMNADLFILLVLTTFCALCVAFAVVIGLSLCQKDEQKYILRELQKAVGQANVILSEEKVLMGCMSTSKLNLAYVSLDGCKHEFAETFSEQDGAEDMFQRAMLYFSSGYTCCLSKKHFPFPQLSSTGHLEGGVCFCQYVSQQLSRGQWE